MSLQPPEPRPLRPGKRPDDHDEADHDVEHDLPTGPSEPTTRLDAAGEGDLDRFEDKLADTPLGKAAPPRSFTRFPEEIQRAEEAKRKKRRTGTHPAPAAPRRAACVIPTLGVSVIVISLIILALFLPPFSAWKLLDEAINGTDEADQSSKLTALKTGAPRLEVAGLTVSADPTLLAELSEPFEVRIDAVLPEDYVAGLVPADNWHCTDGWPGGYAFASRIYSLSQSGTAPERLTLQVSALAAESGTNSARLGLYAWNGSTNAWEFLPSQPTSAPGVLTATSSYLPRCVVMFRVPESAREVAVTLPLGQAFDAELPLPERARIYTGEFHPKADGSLQIVLHPDAPQLDAFRVIPLITNYTDPAVLDRATVPAILADETLRTQHAQQIAAYALDAANNYAGVALDYRAVPPAQRDSYTALLRKLAELLHTQDRTLTVVLPAPVCNAATQSCETGGYDWAAIGRIADEVLLTMPLDPLAYTAQGQADLIVRWATTQIERSRLKLSLSALSVEERDDGVPVPVMFDAALAYLGAVQVDPADTAAPGDTIVAAIVPPEGIGTMLAWDQEAHTAFARYRDADNRPLATMWLTGPAALRFRMTLAEQYNLGGVVVRDMLPPRAAADPRAAIAPGLEKALLDFQAGDSTVIPLETAVTWLVYDGEAVIRQEMAPLAQPFSFTVEPGPAALTIEAQVGGYSLGRATITLAAEAAPDVHPDEVTAATPTEPAAEPATEPSAEPSAEITPEPSPEPSAEPTVQAEAAPLGQEDAAPEPAQEPSPAPTTEPAAEPAAEPAPEPASETPDTTADAAADAVTGFIDPASPLPAPVLPAQTATTPFEAGAQIGQVSGTTMRGMFDTKLTWVKLAVAYTPGLAASDLQSTIEGIHASNYKVLFVVTGSVDDIQALGGPAYAEQYTAYVGELAALGADAIEIWQHMNDEALWPVDSLGAPGYTQLLALAYNAIKMHNRGTLVITGGLRPVAAANEVETLADDAAFLGALADSGAAAYADCLGVHYLDGTVSPASTSGDARGDDPVYYLGTLTDRAATAFGSAIPLCYTRLGYWSGASYPAVPVGFEWAAGITLDQQGQWLAEALRQTRGDERVRLAIIYQMKVPSLDDPIAEIAYSIIQPDSTCPACKVIGEAGQ